MPRPGRVLWGANNPPVAVPVPNAPPGFPKPPKEELEETGAPNELPAVPNPNVGAAVPVPNPPPNPRGLEVGAPNADWPREEGWECQVRGTVQLVG